MPALICQTYAGDFDNSLYDILTFWFPNYFIVESIHISHWNKRCMRTFLLVFCYSLNKLLYYLSWVREWALCRLWIEKFFHILSELGLPLIPWSVLMYFDKSLFMVSVCKYLNTNPHWAWRGVKRQWRSLVHRLIRSLALYYLLVLQKVVIAFPLSPHPTPLSTLPPLPISAGLAISFLFGLNIK